LPALALMTPERAGGTKLSTQHPQPEFSMSPPRWTVPSATTEGTEYEVTVDQNGERVCPCPASQYPKTKGKCWHLKAVQSGVIKPRVRVTQRPTPTPTVTPAVLPGEGVWQAMTRARGEIRRRGPVSDEMAATIAQLDV
jgi:hypothetical protein